MHEVIQWLHFITRGITQYMFDTPFRFTGEKGHAYIHRFLQVRLNTGQHSDAPTDVEPTDTHLHVLRAELARQVHGPWELIGLDTDKHHQPVYPGAPQPPDNFPGLDPRIGFVIDG